jgi:hypothetical protein
VLNIDRYVQYLIAVQILLQKDMVGVCFALAKSSLNGILLGPSFPWKLCAVGSYVSTVNSQDSCCCRMRIDDGEVEIYTGVH